MPNTLRNTFLSCFSRRCLIEKDLDVYLQQELLSAPPQKHHIATISDARKHNT